MSLVIDFYYDFGSPTAYLAYKRLQQLIHDYSFTLNYKPVLLGGIFKATHNQSPVTVPAKGIYMMKHDLPRFAKRYHTKLVMNPHFPINTLLVMRGAHAAMKENCLERYNEAMYNGFWQQALNLGDVAVVSETLDQAGLDSETLLNLSQSPEIKESLANSTNEAVERGAFGAPTFFIADEMFFGQDRMDFIEERLQAANAKN